MTMFKFLLIVGLTMAVEGRIINEIAFYQEPVCNGHHFAMTLGRGECKRVPEWLTQEGWNLSVDPKGHCIQVYENPSCLESVRPAAAAYGLSFNSREEVIKRCRSTKQLGFTTIKSFRQVPC